MAQPYVGEIRMFAGTYAPAGWMFCAGQLLSILENEPLFQLLGTTYGGDGQTTFALPDLQSRVPIHQGQGPGISNNYILAETGGTESVTLSVTQIPLHSHIPSSSTTGGSDSPANNFWGASTNGSPYVAAPGNLTMNAAAIGMAGGNQPHDNMIPYLAVSYIISLYGVYPTFN